MIGRILVTGGAGYIGSHVNCMLCEKGYETIVLDNLSHGHRDFIQWGQFLKGDISDKNLLADLFGKLKIDAVMHFAAYAYVGESVTNPSKYYFNNVGGTLVLLDAMRMAGVDTLIFSSTCATYGDPQAIPIKEDCSQNPLNPYGRTKKIIEKAMKDFSIAYGLKFVTLRYFNAAGADDKGRIGERHNPETHLIPLALDAAKNQKKQLHIYGTDYDTPDGTCVRDYIHVSDLSNAHILALEYLMDGGNSEVFNLGNCEGFSVRDIINCVEKITGRQIMAIESDRRSGDPPILIGSSEKIYRILDWKPKITDIENIIHTAWNWYKKEKSM